MLEEELLKLLLCLVVGSLIGWERKHREKPVGMRTMSLVCIGACLATIITAKYAAHDTGRILAGIVTGIGFLGAGAIISRGSNVHGLTTATSIWAIAIIGMIIGLGDYLLAIAASLIMFLLLQVDIIGRKIVKHSDMSNAKKRKI